MKKALVIIIVGLSGVIGYQMEQRAKLKASNDELKLEIESLGEVNDELEFAVRSLVFENSNLQDELHNEKLYNNRLMHWVEETYDEIYMEER